MQVSRDRDDGRTDHDEGGSRIAGRPHEAQREVRNMGKTLAALCYCGEPLAKYAVKTTKKSAEAAGKCAACGFKGAVKITKK